MYLTKCTPDFDHGGFDDTWSLKFKSLKFIKLFKFVHSVITAVHELPYSKGSVGPRCQPCS